MPAGKSTQMSFNVTASSGFTWMLWDGGPHNLLSGGPGGGLWLPPISPEPINGPQAAALGQVPPHRVPPRGDLVGVDCQLGLGGGWTFNSFRVRIVEPPTPFNPFIWGATAFSPSVVLDSWVLFDSGTLASATASASVPFIRENFSDRPQPFGSWLVPLIEWGTSAGAGQSSFILTMHADVNQEMVG